MSLLILFSELNLIEMQGVETRYLSVDFLSHGSATSWRKSVHRPLEKVSYVDLLDCTSEKLS